MGIVRGLLGLGVLVWGLVGCSTDTFVGPDGGDAAPDAQVRPIVCPTTSSCNVVTEVCCATGASDQAKYACTSNDGIACPGGCGTNTTYIACEGNDTCAALGGVCCGHVCGDAKFDWVHCVPGGACDDPDAGLHEVCATSNAAHCGCTSPQPSTLLPGYSVCP